MRACDALAKLLVVGVPVVLMAGCDLPTDTQGTNPPAATEDWQSTTDLQSPYGGYTLADEPVAFADPEMMRIEAIEGAPQPVAEADTLPSDSTYVVRILWGQLRGDREAQAVIDWTGSLSLSAGRLAVRRTIAFEFPADHLVLPRTDRNRVDFVSHTQPHFDGLLLIAHATAPSGGTDTAATGSLTFATGPYTNTWTLAELVGANLVIPVDDLGNAVSINAMPIRPRECPKGFARGAWVAGDGDRGVLRGTWLAANGDVIGAMRGHFGIDAAGAHLWFAKIIGRDGRVIGLARGQWTPSADPAIAGGQFQGIFAARLGLGGGEIAGRYVPGRVGDNGATGFFEARWQRHCDDQPGPVDPGRDPRPN